MANIQNYLTRLSQHLWLVWCVPLGIVFIALLGVLQWHHRQYKTADAWRYRAEHSIELAAQIRQLRSQPRRYDDKVMESHRLVALVEKSAGASGVSLKQLMSIRPEAPQRIRNTSYVETYIHIRMTNLTLEQLARFPWSLQQNVPGVAIPKMRVWAQSAQSERWEADLTIIGLAYVPRLPDKQNGSLSAWNTKEPMRQGNS